MTPSNRPILLLAALSGILAVGFGAFAAHGMADPKAQEWLRTGAIYGLAHAAAALAALPRSRWAPLLMAAGALVFSGALYGLALGGPRLLGAVAPVGGLAMLAGWVVLLVTAARAPTPDRPGGS